MNQEHLKTIINNMVVRMGVEKDKKQIEIPLDSIIDRIVFYTALSKQQVLDLCDLTMFNSPNIIIDDLPLNLLSTINSGLLYFYQRGHVPSNQELFNFAQASCANTPKSVDSFKRILMALGYELKQIASFCTKYLLIENPKIKFERNLYLKKISKMRAKNCTVYTLDVRMITTEFSFRKPWSAFKITPNTTQFLTDGIMFYHVLSKHGINNFIYTNSLSQDEFRKWVIDIVLPTLDPHSVVVMENNPLLGPILSNPITRYHSKSDMLGVLKHHNIPCSASMSKAELYSLIEKTGCLKSHTSLDLCFRAHGHELITLPTNYQSLSVADVLWDHLRQTLSTLKRSAELKDQNAMVMKDNLQTVIAAITPAHWQSMQNKILTMETQILKLDNDIDEALEKNFLFIHDKDLSVSNPLYFENI